MCASSTHHSSAAAARQASDAAALAGGSPSLHRAPTQAYDQHLNMILGEVEETITTVEIDDETYEEIIKVRAGLLAAACPGPLVT